MTIRPHIKLAAAVVVLVLAGAAFLVAGDILAQLGLKEPQAREQVVEGLNTGNVPTWPASKAFNAATVAARAGLVTDGLAWVKLYTGTADFRDRWAKLRLESKPEAPQSAADQIKKMEDDQRKNIEEMKKNLASMSAEVRAFTEKSIKQAEDQLNDPKQQAQVRQIYEEQAAAQQKRYEQDLARWEADHPADPRALIARRLRAFLDVSGQVNYNAQVARQGSRGLLVFTDPTLEAQSQEWKLCYRAGKPAVDAARAFATTWLAELDRK
jgi:hypothetical protein